ncbi:MAG: hypothetical protein M3Y91_10045 [Actinomycetota bacterium]|nr:hypothetical protein [Actinomycetota bacterium]
MSSCLELRADPGGLRAYAQGVEALGYSHHRRSATEAGRDPSTMGMEGRVTWGTSGAEGVADHAGQQA